MKVCFITPRAKIHSGGEKSMFELIETLQEKNVEIKMIVLEKEGPLYEELDKRGIEHRHVSTPFWMGFDWEKEIDTQERFKDIFESATLVASIIQKWKCDIVYTNTSIVNVGNIAATLINKPHVWHVRESVKDNEAYKLLMPFENIAGHFSTSNNLVIFISKYLENQYSDYKIYDNYRTITNHVSMEKEVLKDAPKEIKVDVVIPFYNDPSTLNCLASLVEHKSESLNKVYVIDDQGPNRDTAKKVEDFTKDYDWIEYVENEENKGFVFTCNRGMQELSDNDVVLLNSDTEVTENWIEKLKQVGYQDEKIGTVTPLSNAASYYSIPDQFNKEHDGRPDESNSVLELVAPMKYFYSHTGHGFCYYVKRATIEKFGVFDYKTFGIGYGEESDYSSRLHKAGYHNAISTKTFIYHLEGQSFGTETAEKKKAFTKPNREKLLKRHPEVLDWEKEFHTKHWLDDTKQLFKYFKKHTDLIDAKKITIVGTVHPSKGQMDAVKAIKELNDNDIHLLLVGEMGSEAYYKEITDFADKNGIKDQIHYLGTVRDARSVIEMADVCLMTSTKEAWGRVTVEYMILGRPVIGTNTGATKDIVKDGVTGYIYEPGDYQSLANNINAILDNADLSEKMGTAAIEIVKAINNKNYGEEIYNEFKKLVKEENKLSYSAFLSPWFISNYFDGSIAKQFVRGMKHWVFHRTFIFKVRHIFKTIRVKLAIKGKIYKLLGKDAPY